MPSPLSAEAKQLIDRPNFTHLATLMSDGSPQSVPVWIEKARYTKLPFEHTPPK